MYDTILPDLTFPDLTYGKHETPWDLRCLLYRGGAAANARDVAIMIDRAELGRPIAERIDLVTKMHEALANQLGRGGRRYTLESQIARLRSFFSWVDMTENPLDMESAQSTYLHWTDALLHRVRTSRGFKENTAYQYGLIVGRVLDIVLARDKPLIRTSRLRYSKGSPRAVSVKADKQNLEDTFAFGHFLLDVANSVSQEAVWGPLPLRIECRNGKVLEEWSGLKRPETLKKPSLKNTSLEKYLAKKTAERRRQWEADRTLRTRYSLVNLRIMTEMFMLMGQPSINLAQAHQLRMDQWRYKPSIHGYEVRTYKNRRWGPVEFEIYSEYREVFDRYLKWRAAIFPNDPDGLLFPLIGRKRINHKPPSFDLLKERCQRAGVVYISPSALRNTNINWMLRRTNDPDLTAAVKQHSKKTLISIYERPSQQRAMVQIKNYWKKHDPAHTAAGPGSCTSNAPATIPDTPATASKPDCLTPAGCLFCVHLREIDSFDHVWSLTTYRLLKSLELASVRSPESKRELPLHPAELAVERVTDKLAFIRESNARRENWVKEALLRINEGRYHPDWAGMIQESVKVSDCDEN